MENASNILLEKSNATKFDNTAKNYENPAINHGECTNKFYWKYSIKLWK